MPQQFTSRPEIRGTFGAVASTHWLASAVGMGMPERGGNAFDAAVAAGFTLQIVEPHLNGPGGDQQEQWTLAVLLRHLHHRQNLQAAIDAPAFHSTHYIGSFYPRAFEPGGLTLEARFPRATRDRLAEQGHKLHIQPDWALGRVCAAGFTRDMSLLRAAATPRFMQAYAVGR